MTAEDPHVVMTGVLASALTGLDYVDQGQAKIDEALEPILRRLVAIERALGLREKIEVPQATRRRPLGA